MQSGLFYSLAASVVFGQCTPDLLIDDFGKIDLHDYEGATRYFNLVGGDYGAVNITASYEPSEKHAKLVATAPQNFWFSKFDLGACFDLSRYSAIEFDIVAEVGSDALFTLTQKTADCKERVEGGDSVYVPLTEFITPNGKKQRVVQPLSAFHDSVIPGKPFDMLHLKDWTLVNLIPVGTTAYISNFVLKGNCEIITLPGFPSTPSSATPSSATSGSTPEATSEPNNAVTGTVGLFTGVLAIIFGYFA